MYLFTYLFIYYLFICCYKTEKLVSKTINFCSLQLLSSAEKLIASLNKLDRESLSELKAFKSPPNGADAVQS